jgi:ankyrin repeat protein
MSSSPASHSHQAFTGTVISSGGHVLQGNSIGRDLVISRFEKSMFCPSDTNNVMQDQSGPSYEQIETLLENFFEGEKERKDNNSRTSSQSETSREAWTEVRAKMKDAGVKGVILKENQDAILALLEKRVADEALIDEDNADASEHTYCTSHCGDSNVVEDQTRADEALNHSVTHSMDKLVHVDCGYNTEFAMDIPMKHFIDEFHDIFIDDYGLKIAVDTIIKVRPLKRSVDQIWNWKSWEMWMKSLIPYTNTPPSLTVDSQTTKNPLIDFLVTKLLHANTKLLVAASKGDIEEIRAQIAQGGNVDHQNSRGWNAMHFAAHRGYTEIIQLLFEHGMNANSVTAQGETPLFLAARGKADSVRLLLSFGADVTLNPSYGETVLERAVASDNLMTISLLLKKGAALAAGQMRADGALLMAVNRGRHTLTELLLEDRAELNPPENEFDLLESAIQTGNAPLLHQLLNHGISPRQLPSDGNMSLLSLAGRRGNESMVKLLLESGADPTVQDDNGKTPLHEAADWGSKESVQMLIDFGGSVSVRDKDGYTPLHAAAKGGHSEIIEILSLNGADGAARDIYGRYPLHLATMEGNIEAVQTLLNLGADPCAKDDRGKTAVALITSAGMPFRTITTTIKALFLLRGAEKRSIGKTKSDGAANFHNDML